MQEENNNQPSSSPVEQVKSRSIIDVDSNSSKDLKTKVFFFLAILSFMVALPVSSLMSGPILALAPEADFYATLQKYTLTIGYLGYLIFVILWIFSKAKNTLGSEIEYRLSLYKKIIRNSIIFGLLSISIILISVSTLMDRFGSLAITSSLLVFGLMIVFCTLLIIRAGLGLIRQKKKIANSTVSTTENTEVDYYGIRVRLVFMTSLWVFAVNFLIIAIGLFTIRSALASAGGIYLALAITPIISINQFITPIIAFSGIAYLRHMQNSHIAFKIFAFIVILLSTALVLFVTFTNINFLLTKQ